MLRTLYTRPSWFTPPCLRGVRRPRYRAIFWNLPRLLSSLSDRAPGRHRLPLPCRYSPWITPARALVSTPCLALLAPLFDTAASALFVHASACRKRHPSAAGFLCLALLAVIAWSSYVHTQYSSDTFFPSPGSMRYFVILACVFCPCRVLRF